MGAKNLAVIGLSALSLASCSYGAGLRASTSTPSRLARYHTYFVLDGGVQTNETADQRIRSDLETALNGRGWTAVPRKEAEAVVVAHVATDTGRTYQAFYQGWGGWPWKDCTSAGVEGQNAFKAGTLVVDIFDADTKQALWSGVAPNAARPDASSRATEQAIAKMFREFPTTEPTGDETRAVHDATFSSGSGPRIIFERAPAVLVQIDGTPEYRPIGDTGLDRVVNARPFIVRDDAGLHYMKVGDGWMQSYTLTGLWSVAGTVPDSAAAALANAVRETGPAGIELLDDRSLDVAGSDPTSVVAVHVSTTPAVLIVTRGEPQFAPVGSTKLLYMKNASGRVLEEPTDHEWYVLAAGEWYRAWAEGGPWQHVDAGDLPADFAQEPQVK